MPADFLLRPCLAAALLSATPCAWPAGDPAEAAHGRRLIEQYQCGACHAIPGVAGARGTLGPPLADIGRRSYIAGRVPNRGALLAQWIADPRSLVPDTTMPDLGVPPAQARAMAAYLGTLR